jgi:nicotinate phosphoribosyltransferase
MHQFFFHNYPSSYAKYKFKNRSNVNLVKYIPEIEEEIHNLCNLTFTKEELKYLSKLNFIREDYLDFLSGFRLKEKYILVEEKDNKLSITISGPIIQVMLFEIYVLKIIQEIYTNDTYNFSKKDYNKNLESLKNELDSTIISMLFEFGTRRCFNSFYHEKIIQLLKNYSFFKGTSNVYFAKKYNLKPIGTMAHEYIQFFQGLYHPNDSQKIALKSWLDYYGENLSICLTDTLGLNKFKTDFDYNLASLYSGIRQDSGCPFEFIDKMIDHYYDLNIDHSNKLFIFSDNINITLANKLQHRCYEENVNCGFGIGTYLVNNLKEAKGLQMVIKMVESGKDEYMTPVAKISDSSGKEMCESLNYINYLKELICFGK